MRHATFLHQMVLKRETPLATRTALHSFDRTDFTCCLAASDGYQSSPVQDLLGVRGQLTPFVTAPALWDGVTSSIVELHLRTHTAKETFDELTLQYIGLILTSVACLDNSCICVFCF